MSDRATPKQDQHDRPSNSRAPGQDDSNRGPTDASEDQTATDDDAHRPHVDVGDLRAKAAFAGAVVIHGDFVVGEGRKQLMTVDVTESFGQRSAPFIPPANYSDIKRALDSRGVVILQAPDRYGRRLAAARALLDLKRSRVLLIPGAKTSDALAENIRLLAEREPFVAIIVSDIDARMFRQLADHGFGQIRAIADETACVVVVICDDIPKDVSALEPECISVDLPPCRRVLEAYASHFNVDAERHRLAVDALDILAADLTPLAVIQLLDHCQQVRADASSNDVVARFNGTQSENALALWLQEERGAQEIASLVVGAAFSGELESLAHDAVAVLEGILEAPVDERVAVSYSSRYGWPVGIVERATREQTVHFGRHSAHTIRLCEPHTQEWVMSYLWRTLGGQFQSDVVEWLHLLSQSNLRLHAANAAGLLFLHDPIVIEARVLRPWAMSDDVRQRQSAGWAIGVPSVWGADVGASRGLAKSWLRGGNDPLKHAAIIALGGPLGQWDIESYAPLMLFEAGVLNPHLVDATNQALVSLMVSDPDASATRSIVLGLLVEALNEPGHRLRIFAILSLAIQRFFGRDGRAQRSLARLRYEPEQYGDFVTILTEALVDPLGATHGRASLRRMLVATSTGDFAERDIVELIDLARTEARRRRQLRRLGDTLRQTLEAGRRQEDVLLRSTCERLLDRYF